MLSGSDLYCSITISYITERTCRQKIYQKSSAVSYVFRILGHYEPFSYNLYNKSFKFINSREQ